MSRRRFLVALVPPEELSDQLRAVRRLVDGPRRERIVPHVTLVPPFNTRDDSLSELRGVLRSVASATRPFDLRLGPAASFAPKNATLHLAVGGDAESLAELRALRERVRTGPMGRPDRHPFVPHLTLRRGVDDTVAHVAADVMSGHLEWTADRVHLLEQVHDGAVTVWRPLAEEPFGGPVVVGRGGVELHLRTITIAEERDPDGVRVDPVDDPHPGRRLVVVAEPPGAPGRIIGRAHGRIGASTARLDRLEVLPHERGVGVARHVVARWCTDAASVGVDVVVADGLPPDVTAALGVLGFTVIGELAVRRLTGPAGR